STPWTGGGAWPRPAASSGRTGRTSTGACGGWGSARGDPPGTSAPGGGVLPPAPPRPPSTRTPPMKGPILRLSPAGALLLLVWTAVAARGQEIAVERPDLPRAVADRVIAFYNDSSTVRFPGRSRIPPGTAIEGNVAS